MDSGTIFIVLFYMATLYDRYRRLVENRQLRKKLDAARSAAKDAQAERLETMNQTLTADITRVLERLARLEAHLIPDTVPRQPLAQAPRN
jgi:hypothetical protein